MSKRTTRRGLLAGLVDSLRAEPGEAPAPRVKGFSLEAFYAKREPPCALPPVVLREGLPSVVTTPVGLCPAIDTGDDEGARS